MNVKTVVKAIKYPRLRDYNLDRRFKLTEKQINEIRKKRQKGATIISIAKHFKISTTTVCYYIYLAVNAMIRAKNAKRKSGKTNEYIQYARKVLYNEHRKYLTFIKWKKDNTRKNTLTNKIIK